MVTSLMPLDLALDVHWDASWMTDMVGEVFYVDFDGAEDVTYSAPITIAEIDVDAFRIPAARTALDADDVIDEALLALKVIWRGV